MTKFSFALPALATLALVAGCAPTFEARVSRFNALPPAPPTGQTFALRPADPQLAGSLEFQTYANLVRQRLVGFGFVEAPADNASLIVSFDYGVGAPRTKIESRPGFYGGAGWWGPGWGGWGGGGFGRRGWYSSFYGGWYDPFYAPRDIYSVTQYNSFADVRIRRMADKQAVFEGHAETVGQTNDLTKLVPNLVTAIFTNFPGRSGETVRVQFDPADPSKAPIIHTGR